MRQRIFRQNSDLSKSYSTPAPNLFKSRPFSAPHEASPQPEETPELQQQWQPKDSGYNFANVSITPRETNPLPMLQRKLTMVQQNEAAVMRDYDDYIDQDYDYDEYEEEDDTIDPELSQYMHPGSTPTLGDYMEPHLAPLRAAEERKKREERAKREKRAKKQQKKQERTDKDVIEHGERRTLNKEAHPLAEEHEEIGLAIEGLSREISVKINLLGDKKSKAGQKASKLGGKNWGEQWQTQKDIINQVAEEATQALQEVQPLRSALEGEVKLDVPTQELKKIIKQLKDVVGKAKPAVVHLESILKRIDEQLKSLDQLIGKDAKNEATKIEYPQVYIHNVVKKCPFYRNIPFEDLNKLTQTGTHGKSGHGAFVHKKVAGGCAITFGYQAGRAYVIDWGNKAPNSQQYKWNRGSTSYDSNAGIGDLKDYFQV